MEGVEVDREEEEEEAERRCTEGDTMASKERTSMPSSPATPVEGVAGAAAMRCRLRGANGSSAAASNRGSFVGFAKEGGALVRVVVCAAVVGALNSSLK